MGNDNHKKTGFVVMIGRSNVGKSTLMNAIIGSKIAITSPKPQTTRFPIQGILTRDNVQMIFVDTPGVLKGQKDTLSKKMTSSVKDSLQEVDVIVYVVDPTREIADEERAVMKMIQEIKTPKILVINKIDIPKKPFLDYYRDIADQYDDVIELSALKGSHVGSLINKIIEYLPKGEFLYPEHQLTNIPNKEWLAEIIREKLFLRLRQEVPYSTHVEVIELEKRENEMLYIQAIIYTTDDRYQRMIIGKGGRGIKEIGQSARKELEAVTNKKIYLDLNVEVDPHWMERFF